VYQTNYNINVEILNSITRVIMESVVDSSASGKCLVSRESRHNGHFGQSGVWVLQNMSII